MTGVNPSDGTQPARISEPTVDADVDALLEVIKQKDAVIDNCRSSLHEYAQERWGYISTISDLENEIERLKRELARPGNRFKEMITDNFLLYIIGVVIGWFGGVLLGAILFS